jgi:hypothetical protein
MIENLVDQYISDTYGLVVQYESGSFYDGFGNFIGFTGSITGSGFIAVTSGSNTFRGDQIISGSLTVTGSLVLPNQTPYSLIYTDTNYNLNSLPTPLSPITSSGDVVAMFVSSSNTWIMTDTINGGEF